MPSRETLKLINGPDALAELDAVRAARHEHGLALHAERAKLLGGVASEGGIVPTAVAREIADQARANTGEHPVTPA